MTTLTGLTSSTLHKALRKKDIRINDIRINEDTIIHEFDTITIFIIDDLLYKKINLEKIYEDDNILIINKPVRLEVVSTSDEETATTHIAKRILIYQALPSSRQKHNRSSTIRKNTRSTRYFTRKIQKQRNKEKLSLHSNWQNAKTTRNIKSLSI